MSRSSPASSPNWRRRSCAARRAMSSPRPTLRRTTFSNSKPTPSGIGKRAPAAPFTNAPAGYVWLKMVDRVTIPEQREPLGAGGGMGWPLIFGTSIYTRKTPTDHAVTFRSKAGGTDDRSVGAAGCRMLARPAYQGRQRHPGFRHSFRGGGKRGPFHLRLGEPRAAHADRSSFPAPQREHDRAGGRQGPGAVRPGQFDSRPRSTGCRSMRPNPRR
jgi:hypothetical protein